MILINPVLSLRSSRFSASEHPITHSNEYVNVIYKYNEYVKFKKVEKQPKTDKCTLQQLGGHLFKMSVFTCTCHTSKAVSFVSVNMSLSA